VFGAAIVGAAAGMAYAVRGRSSSVLGPSVWRGSQSKPAVALTFDDGPSESTPELLELLTRFGISATFFQCGMNVRRLPRIAASVARAGHEVANHSHTHRYLCFRSASAILEEFSRAQEAIQTATGIAPALMRPPYGVRWFGFDAMQRRLGLLGVMWTVIGRDWRLPGSAVAAHILRAVANGAIICLHDGRELRVKPDTRSTLEAVRLIVPELKDRGLQFETVSQLLCPMN
jgi:peptidoglycan-N-acetylglucosamine deacetylase